MPVTTNITPSDLPSVQAPSSSPSPTPSLSPASSATFPSKPHGKNKWKNAPPPPPSDCVVLKNLDYNITQVTLEEVVRRVTGGRKEFVNIALIDDRVTGSFRGMAFVNFHSVPDATAALAELRKMVINGRKVIAEYRRLRPGEKERQEKRAKRFDHFNNNTRQTFEKDVQEVDEKGVRLDKRVAFFAKRDTVRKVDEQKRNDEKAERDKDREAQFRKTLIDYNAANVEPGEPIEDTIFSASLTSYERRMVHMLCAEFELGHISRVNDEGQRVLHVTKDPETMAKWDIETAAVKAVQKTEEAQKRKTKEAPSAPEWKKGDVTTGGPLTKEELHGIKWFKPRSAMTTAEAGEASANSAVSGLRAPSYKVYVPPRQPSGPDGTIGFSSRAANRKLEEGDAPEEANGEKPGKDEAMDEMNGEVVKEEVVVVEKGQVKVERKASSQSSLDPSVPAFSPSSAQMY